jgi:hypothetical protein
MWICRIFNILPVVDERSHKNPLENPEKEEVEREANCQPVHYPAHKATVLAIVFHEVSSQLIFLKMSIPPQLRTQSKSGLEPKSTAK